MACIFVPLLVGRTWVKEEREYLLLGVMLLGVMVALLIYFSIGLHNRMKQLDAGSYEAHRTKIISKEVHRVHVQKSCKMMKVPYYLCDGIDGQVSPISKEFYNAAKPGDDVTVVWIAAKGILLGITFPE